MTLIQEIPRYFTRYFETFQTLQQYFNIDFNEQQQQHQQNDNNSVNLKELLELNNNILIIPDTKTVLRFFPLIEHENNEPLNILLNDIIASLVSDIGCENVLKTGYELQKPSESSNIQKLVCKRNDCSDLRTNAWSLLLSRVGVERFTQLLLDNIILLRLPNNFYVQLAGYSIHKRLKNTRQLLPAQSHPQTYLSVLKDKKSTLSSIVSKTFSESSDKAENKGKKRKTANQDDGVFKKVKYNCMTAMINRVDLIGSKTANKIKVPEQDFIDQTLSNLFSDDFRTEKKKKQFLKRYESIPDLIKRIYQCQHKLPIRQLRNHFCPISRSKRNDKMIDDLMVKNNQIFMFISSYLKNLIPLDFFGSEHNLNVFLTGVSSFMFRKRHEKLRVDEVLHKFKINDCKWLRSSSNRSLPSDLEKQRNILCKMVQWIFTDLIIPILKSMFHITLTSNFKNQLIYFRCDVWNKLVNNFMSKLIHANYFIPIEKKELLALKLGSGRIRFIPKKNGLRLITNLTNTTRCIFNPGTGSIVTVKDSVNKALRNTLNVLNHERIQQPEAMGSSVFGNNLLYSRLKEYKKRFSNKENNQSKFYFCKVDAKDCFDSINQEKLLQELEHFLASPEYTFQYILKCFSGDKGSIFISKDYIATTKDQKYPLSTYLNGISGTRSGTIMIEQVRQFTSQVSDLYTLLKEHVISSTIKYKDNFYKKGSGIPQGSCLSALLCSFFYGKLEREKLGALKQDQNGILLHYVDDFLYITKDKKYAKLFHDTMTDGFPDFGFEINKSKTLTNVDKDEMTEFPWLSYLLNVNTLDVKCDLDNIYLKSKRLTTQISYANQPGKHMMNVIKRSLKTGVHNKILMDHEFNSKETVWTNLQENFMITAIKAEMVAFQVTKGVCGFLNERFIFDSILKSIKHIIPFIPSRFDENDVTRLYLEEMYKVFNKKKTKYPRLLHCLKSCISYHSWTKQSKRLFIQSQTKTKTKH